MNAKDAIKLQIVDAVREAVHRPEVFAQQRDVIPIAKAVADAVVPQIAHATNNEPWYQSRVTIGAIVSIAIPLLGAIGITSDVIDADQLTALIVAAGSLVGGIITLYGRWKARKPIGQ